MNGFDFFLLFYQQKELFIGTGFIEPFSQARFRFWLAGFVEKSIP